MQNSGPMLHSDLAQQVSVRFQVVLSRETQASEKKRGRMLSFSKGRHGPISNPRTRGGRVETMIRDAERPRPKPMAPAYVQRSWGHPAAIAASVGSDISKASRGLLSGLLNRKRHCSSRNHQPIARRQPARSRCSSRQRMGGRRLGPQGQVTVRTEAVERTGHVRGRFVVQGDTFERKTVEIAQIQGADGHDKGGRSTVTVRILWT